MGTARCLCPHGSDGKKCGRNDECPFHGPSSSVPSVMWFVSSKDKPFLRLMRIDPEDAAEIQDVRQADEDRFKRE